MTNVRTIHALYRHLADLDPLFKQRQKRIIEKLELCQPLSENEKRYLRGRMGDKVDAIGRLLAAQSTEKDNDLQILGNLPDYYITGFEALKNNGFGWYYDTKVVSIINTRLKGKINITNSKRIRFIRVKSLRGRRYSLEPGSGLKYASNEQVLDDARMLGDKAIQRVWWTMFERYPDIFVKNKSDFVTSPSKDDIGDIEDYGV
jgi:hypothetical protein